ncbi:S8 family peptidase [Jiangella endophytica]|uniref:S8 family peptidase n=1 Tax=Jiangella endophytica TaxID=1623398 RepID=UPI000E34FC24|nr:S8 family serine peptidase [Jiangella endophytica]
MSGRSGTSRRRLPAILLGGSVVATLVAATPGHADGPAATPANAAATTLGAAPHDVTVTLVTGDRVQVHEAADGRQSITVDPAPRPNGVVPQFHVTGRGDTTSVIPTDVAALVPSRLDAALFDIETLAAQRAGDTLPLILDYADDMVRPLDAEPVPGAATALELPALNAVAVDAEPGVFGAAVLGLTTTGDDVRTLASQPLAGVEKIWLDARIKASLDRSTGQIGAPAAWDAGFDGTGVTVAVLDTGIDDTHPDLAGKVQAAANFSSDPDTTDGAGHGTHVASTAAGTGEASGGDRRGVAPGASLLNGKVLNHDGYGEISWALAGMEWAAQQGADIVNMSFGLGPGHVEAPLLTATVERLAAEYGILFVAAAGNERCAACIGSPADAPSALTVGAVDREDRLAAFSNRGPVFGRYSVKPDVTAPGVSISAARAGGGDPYVAYTGTSMAAPHAAGAAALLAQAYPDLTAAELKSALMSTAIPSAGQGLFDQGTGRIDVRRALAGPVLAGGEALDFGLVPFPEDGPVPPQQRTVTYRNVGDAPVTVRLEADLPGADAGGLTVTPSQLVVEPGTVATAEVVLDVAGGTPGQYAGELRATASGAAPVRMPVSFEVEAEHFEVTLTAVAGDGRPALPFGSFLPTPIVSVDTGEQMWEPCRSQVPEQAICVRVPGGTYSMLAWVVTKPAWDVSDGSVHTTTPLHSALVGDPEVTVAEDMSLVMDAREAVEVEITTPDHETRANLGGAAALNWVRTPVEGPATADYLINAPGAQVEERLFLQPTDEVMLGSFTASTRFRLSPPDITLAADGLRLDPVYLPPDAFSDNSWEFPMFEGTATLPVVDIGDGQPDDLAGLDLDGALALVRRSDTVPTGEQVNRAAAAGAALVAVYHDRPGSSAEVTGDPVHIDVPAVRLSHEQGLALLERLADGPLTVTATGDPDNPLRYDLVHTERGQIPADLSHVADADELAAVERDLHVQLDGTLSDTSWAFEPGADFSVTWAYPIRTTPDRRVDYYVPDPGTEWQHGLYTPQSPYNHNWPDPFVTPLKPLSPFLTYDEPGRRQTSWLRQPLVPGFDSSAPMTRQGDELIIPTAGYVDADDHFAEAVADGDGAGYDGLFQVWHGDRLLGEASGRERPGGTIPLPPGDETYRIDYSLENHTPWAALSTRTRTSWTFVSGTTPADQPPAVVPLLTLDHDFGADLGNRLPGPRDRRGPNEISVAAGHLAGAESRITGLTVDVSYDDGASWQPLRVRRTGDTFAAHLPNRPPRGHTGFVSLRFGAADAAGNRIDQEIIRAAALPAD